MKYPYSHSLFIFRIDFSIYFHVYTDVYFYFAGISYIYVCIVRRLSIKQKMLPWVNISYTMAVYNIT